MLGLNIGIDLGTTKTIVCVEGKGIVIHEPSVIAYEKESGRLLASGKKAYDMIGRNPDSIKVISPIRDGVISDFTAIKNMMVYYIQKICGNRIFKPNVLICTPSSVTSLEMRTVLDLATSSGAGKACIIEEALAAAVGAGVDVMKPNGSMIVDIGGGTSDIAVVTMGSIAISKSIKIAGNVLDEAIERYIRRERYRLIGEKTAEDIKKKIGNANMVSEEVAIGVKGKNYSTGMPDYFEVTSTEIYLAMREQIEEIGKEVCLVLEKTPPEMVSDIAENGIILTGGGALLSGMAEFIQKKTGIYAYVADEPQDCVARGVGMALKNLDVLYEKGYTFKSREDITGYVE